VRIARPVPGRLVAGILVGLAIAVSASGCGGSGSTSGESAAPTRNGSVVELKDIQPLREQFEQDAGKARVLMLLAPT
jgi:hypothetical protein